MAGVRRNTVRDRPGHADIKLTLRHAPGSKAAAVGLLSHDLAKLR
jgi:hypothetical protein